MPAPGEDAPSLPVGDLRERGKHLVRSWRQNWRIGWPERARGLHYWLGFEYAAMLPVLRARPGERWLHVASGTFLATCATTASKRSWSIQSGTISSRVQSHLDFSRATANASMSSAYHRPSSGGTT